MGLCITSMRRRIETAFAAALLLVPLGAAGAKADARCAAAVALEFKLERKITRSELGFTQGLLFRAGRLYESTGRVDGSTRINTIALDGKVTTLADKGTQVFGEGLTIIDGEMVQLTWQDHLVLVYDLDGRPVRQMSNPREGWGLTDDGRELIFSDGGPSIHFADPKTFAILRSVKLQAQKPGEVLGLNELELVGDKLYGNIFLTRLIVRLDPRTGCIDAVADLSPLWSQMTPDERRHIGANENYVLNGIAHDPTTGLFYLTGKRWKSIFVGRFSERR
ncbi:MAG: glutaminyl-peptide cyclotransferase [Variibacter sp.]|nr:glutaminyl-peptide cyclotransferase [Variibacter sp.]